MGNKQDQGVNIGLEQGDQPDHTGQDDAVPEDRLEDVGLFANLIGSSRGHADTLGIDHFAHDSPGAVGRANQHLKLGPLKMGKGCRVVLVNPRCRDLLETAKEGVASRIRPGQKDPKPAQDGGKKGIHQACFRERHP